MSGAKGGPNLHIAIDNAPRNHNCGSLQVNLALHKERTPIPIHLQIYQQNAKNDHTGVPARCGERFTIFSVSRTKLSGAVWGHGTNCHGGSKRWVLMGAQQGANLVHIGIRPIMPSALHTSRLPDTSWMGIVTEGAQPCAKVGPIRDPTPLSLLCTYLADVSGAAGRQGGGGGGGCGAPHLGGLLKVDVAHARIVARLRAGVGVHGAHGLPGVHPLHRLPAAPPAARGGATPAEG